jgi:diaminobutyrate-2-oxoglutarate transaminase
MAIVLMHPEIDQWSPGEHTGTFRGNSLAFIAGATALKRWDNDEFSKEIHRKGELVEKRFRAIRARFPDHISDVRGLGMIWGIESSIDDFCSQVSREAFEHGLLAETAGATGQVIKFLAPLTISQAELDEGLDILEAAIEATAAIHPIKK